MRKLNNFCPNPFQCIEIHKTGAVYTCCPNWNKFYEIGNIFEHTFDEVWNSPAAVEFRTRIMNNDYSLCDGQTCFYLQNKMFYTDFETNYKPVMEEYPLIIKFAYDFECNIACKICRDKMYVSPEDKLNLLNSKIDSFFLPLLKSAKILIINAAGDPFGSRHSRLIIQKAAETYPSLQFDFHTNGINCNKQTLENLNITADRINQIKISMHAATAKIYSKIINSPESSKLFDRILDNLAFLKEFRKIHPFPLFLNFVVTSENYKEIPAFIDMAEKYNADPHFWEFRQENCAYPMEENLYVCNDNHPLHNELIKIMQNEKIKRYKENFSPILQKLIP